MLAHRTTLLLRLAAALVLTGMAPWTQAQNVANGKALYTAKLCEACHLADVSRNISGILSAANDADRILSECARQRDMAPICATGKPLAVSRAEAIDIAAFVAANTPAPPPPAIGVFFSTELNFTRTVGAGPSGRETLKVINLGGSNLVLADVTLAGANPGDYALLAPAAGARCQAGTTMAANATCSVDVVFEPAVAGTRNASLLVSPAADSGLSPVTIALNGTATAEPLAQVDATELNFGTQVLNTASANRTVVIRNAGSANLVFNATGALVLSGADAQEFALDSAGTCATATPVPPQGSCTVLLRFTPQAAGARVATLTVNSNAAAVSVALTGAGQAGASAEAGSRDQAGGCSVANPNAAVDPVLGLLSLFAAVLLALRRRRGR